MLPPYETAEVAALVHEALEAAGLEPVHVSVIADLPARAWRLEVRLHDGREVVRQYPFADASGIHTPAELARWFEEAVGS